ncbi:hypothetical protein BKD89_07630 [Methanomethylophilus alvi]|nr:hypothetical protein BKD89_07630 [Methanomethylophilus alvi]
MAKQTTFKAADAMAGWNISLSFGIMELVRKGFRRLHLYDFLNGFKEKGVPLGYVVELMCIHQLSGGAYMNKCETDSSSPLAREELCHGYVISRKTMERALDLLDTYFEDTISFLWGRLKGIYPDLDTDVYVDGSHIVRYGSKGENTAAGEGGGTIQLQDQFVVAQLAKSGLPISIELYPGNWNDPPQYQDFIPQLMFMLKEGSRIIMDAGGSDKALLDEIKESDMRYRTRVKMNKSDEQMIDECPDRMQYLDRGMIVIAHRFESSGKTNYLFFSADRYVMGQAAAERRAAKLAQQMTDARDIMKEPKIGKLVTVKRNPFYDVMIKSFEIQMKLNPWLDGDILLAAKEEAGDRCGWFKLQSSEWMEPSEALDIYRHRVGIEHLISSIKSVVNLKPLRVWSRSSVRGSLMLALIAQLQISVLRYDMEPDIIEKMVDGKRTRIEHKPSAKTIIENLIHWTVTLIPRDGWNIERIFSNETDLTREISEILKRYRGCFYRHSARLWRI